MSTMARFLYTLERMSALWPGSAAAVKSQLLRAAYDAARVGGDPLVLALDALRRAAASGQLPDGGLLEDLRPLLKGDALVKALHPAVQLSVLALLRELLPELLEDRAGACTPPAPAARCNCMLRTALTTSNGAGAEEMSASCHTLQLRTSTCQHTGVRVLMSVGLHGRARLGHDPGQSSGRQPQHACARGAVRASVRCVAAEARAAGANHLCADHTLCCSRHS